MSISIESGQPLGQQGPNKPFTAEDTGMTLASREEKTTLFQRLIELAPHISGVPSQELEDLLKRMGSDDLTSIQIKDISQKIDTMKGDKLQESKQVYWDQLTQLQQDWSTPLSSLSEYNDRFKTLQTITLELTKLEFQTQDDQGLIMIQLLSKQLEAQRSVVLDQAQKDLMSIVTDLTDPKNQNSVLEGLSRVDRDTVKEALKGIIQDSDPKQMEQCSQFYELLKKEPTKTDLSKDVMAAFSGIRILNQFSKLSGLIDSGDAKIQNAYDQICERIKNHYLQQGGSIEDILKDFGKQVRGSKLEKALSAASIQSLQGEFMKLFLVEHTQVQMAEPYTVTHVSGRSISLHDHGITIGSTFHYQIADSSGAYRPMFSFPLIVELDQAGNFLSYRMGEKTIAAGLSDELQLAISGFNPEAFQAKYTPAVHSQIKKCLDDIPQFARDLNRELASMILDIPRK